MLAPKMHDYECHRLEDLRALKLLDTPDEDFYDIICGMAQTLFETPIALVSLVDDNRQWFKARIGLDAKQTPRNISFCGHAILSPDVLWVEDALEDDRFKDNPLVLGDPFIRFYAGAPIYGPQGLAIGTVCVIDSHPRRFNGVKALQLADLASLITIYLQKAAA